MSYKMRYHLGRYGIERENSKILFFWPLAGRQSCLQRRLSVDETFIRYESENSKIQYNWSQARLFPKNFVESGLNTPCVIESYISTTFDVLAWIQRFLLKTVRGAARKKKPLGASVSNVSNNATSVLAWARTGMSLHMPLPYHSAAKGIGLLRRSKDLLDSNTLKTIYSAIVLPHFDYCRH